MEKRLMMFLVGLFLSVGMALAQTQVSGTVVSGEDGEPIIGASIKVLGTNTGTVTDTDGKFSLSTPAGSRLEISYIGMKSKTVKAGPNMKVTLEGDNKTLDEVMVVAYGTQKKSAFTGSAATVKSDDISKVQVASPVEALKGKVSGVQMQQSSGQPGQTSSIRIRGISSISSGQAPLYVVDGSPFDGDLNTINPQDIADITVLKDAASAALYGSRGANGVILITTKVGRTNHATVTVDAKWGVNSRALRNYDYINSPAGYYETWYKGLYNYARDKQNMTDLQAFQFANGHLTDASDYGLGYNVYTIPTGDMLIGSNGKLNPRATLGNVVTYKGENYLLRPDNWINATYRNALRQEYTVSATGSTDKSTFYASANYLNMKGITAGSSMKRFTSRLKADYQVKPWMKIAVNMNYAHYDNNQVSSDGVENYTGNLFTLLQLAPIYARWRWQNID
ncbi:SusC/RagA family TonB-linked outer membrane protein [Segatella salivae]|uniref:SusC/RagA family TonB-linked outer membrane protein n=1 Tax=Segatella salivae TaxID=228604 RepID=UPI00356B6F6A